MRQPAVGFGPQSVLSMATPALPITTEKGSVTQRVLAPVDIDPDDQVRDLDDRALVANSDTNPVDIENRIDLIDRPIPPLATRGEASGRCRGERLALP
jgi:hypothetical protein